MKKTVNDTTGKLLGIEDVKKIKKPDNKKNKILRYPKQYDAQTEGVLNRALLTGEKGVRQKSVTC